MGGGDKRTDEERTDGWRDAYGRVRRDTEKRQHFRGFLSPSGLLSQNTAAKRHRHQTTESIMMERCHHQHCGEKKGAQGSGIAQALKPFSLRVQMFL